jgi:23S rRNA (uracil1939-C5)-methyltransferase
MRSIELRIEDVAFGGKGVGRDTGKAVFVPYSIEGELVSATITREKKQFAEAEIIDVLEPSPHRVQPVCPYFGRCGGCVYQHINYSHQLEIKARQVQDLLARIGKLRGIPIRQIIPSPSTYNYRNRVTVHAENGVIGYFRRDSHRLIDVEQCPIAMNELNAELADLRARDVPDGHYTLRARSEPRIFSQTNDAVADALRELVIQLVPGDQELLIDAFCGAGFFAKALLGKFDRVVGIDWDRFAIAAAKQNATAKETYIAADVEEELGHLSASGSFHSADLSKPRAEKCRSATLIVDPPATGLAASLRQTIVDLAPATMIYISCNPATMARDLADLSRRFKIESITPLDMFPQTAEIEALAHLTQFNDSSIRSVP